MSLLPYLVAGTVMTITNDTNIISDSWTTIDLNSVDSNGNDLSLIQTIDGNNKTVTVTGTNDLDSIFRKDNNSSEIIIKNINIISDQYTGKFNSLVYSSFAYKAQYFTIKDSIVDININVDQGGFFGAYSGDSSTIKAINCQCGQPGTNHEIFDSGGGIFGRAVATSGTAIAINCKNYQSMSSELVGVYHEGGGIFGRNASEESGYCVALGCENYGNLNKKCGGIYGSFPFSCDAIGCYNEGLLDGMRCGGIFADMAARKLNKKCFAIGCGCKITQTPTGNQCGGIFGPDGRGVAIACYYNGPLHTSSSGIFGGYYWNSNDATYGDRTTIAIGCYSKVTNDTVETNRGIHGIIVDAVQNNETENKKQMAVGCFSNINLFETNSVINSSTVLKSIGCMVGNTEINIDTSGGNVGSVGTTLINNGKIRYFSAYPWDPRTASSNEPQLLDWNNYPTDETFYQNWHDKYSTLFNVDYHNFVQDSFFDKNGIVSKINFMQSLLIPIGTDVGMDQNYVVPTNIGNAPNPSPKSLLIPEIITSYPEWNPFFTTTSNDLEASLALDNWRVGIFANVIIDEINGKNIFKLNSDITIDTAIDFSNFDVSIDSIDGQNNNITVNSNIVSVFSLLQPLESVSNLFVNGTGIISNTSYYNGLFDISTTPQITNVVVQGYGYNVQSIINLFNTNSSMELKLENNITLQLDSPEVLDSNVEVIDGNGYTITLTSSSTRNTSIPSLFSHNGAEWLTIKNLNVVVENGSTFDGIVNSELSNSANKVKLVECTVTGSISDYKGAMVGNYAGKNTANNEGVVVYRCLHSGTLGIGSGGIVGSHAKQVIVNGCYHENTNNDDNDEAGGIVGAEAGGRTFVISSGSESTIPQYGGGIVGKMSNSNGGIVVVSASYSKGSLSNYSGGIVGSFDDSITTKCLILACYSDATNTPTNAGSIVGGNLASTTPINAVSLGCHGNIQNRGISLFSYFNGFVLLENANGLNNSSISNMEVVFNDSYQDKKKLVFFTSYPWSPDNNYTSDVRLLDWISLSSPGTYDDFFIMHHFNNKAVVLYNNAIYKSILFNNNTEIDNFFSTVGDIGYQPTVELAKEFLKQLSVNSIQFLADLQTNYQSSSFGIMHNIVKTPVVAEFIINRNIIDPFENIEYDQNLALKFNVPIIGGATGDPYVTTLDGYRYKLPNSMAMYRLFQTIFPNNKQLIINVDVTQLNNLEKQKIVKSSNKMSETNGYYFNRFFIKYEQFQMEFDRNLKLKKYLHNNSKDVKIQMDNKYKHLKHAYFGDSMYRRIIIRIQNKVMIELCHYTNPQIINGINVTLLQPMKTSGLLNKGLHPKHYRIKRLYSDKLFKSPQTSKKYQKTISEIFST